MDTTLLQQTKHGIMHDEEREDSLGSFSSLSEDSSGSSSSSSSLSSELTEDTASSGPPSSSSSPKGPLFEMSCLKQQLPFKRGLSNFYQGKSQSFTSFSNIKCLEDLAKPERPLKKLKASKSCGEGLDTNKSLSLLKCCNGRTITKKSSRGSSLSSSMSNIARRGCLLGGNKPPLYPHNRPSSNNLSDQSLWFA